ncbi:MarR family winged helix-turn-helix transcriptional regulator [Flavobacterium sp. NKUCC04_CG]|uniref:MarR family winged helix-turn-helix transcriptional regulator n=1 Tax=Flavobacterium sp. NKUCC04_CG TaxID=2842121 RepID=UPI001C5B9CC9|nr:MarR family transcriptional regulator [Flavobacterium sp. NKUCC04_CG]MBW3519267.1 MarR family transcriptional regulator [Flavobacterium sp. NKUCC04_CG]
MVDQLNLKNQVCFPVYTLAKVIINHYRPLLDELDLTYSQYLVLMVLWENEEQTVGQIGEKLVLDSGTLTPLLKRMEQKDMVVRKRSDQDERVVKLSLTEKGKLLNDRAKEIPHRLMDSMKITENELVELKDIITRILNKQL